MSGRRLGYKRIQGPIFPSFHNQRTGTKKILVWKPGTQSVRQVKKNLRNKAKQILDSKDELIIRAGDRVIYSVRADPDPEYSALHLFCEAIDMRDDTGESWVTCITYLMDKFDEIDERSKDAEATKPTSTSYLRKLLRTLVPRSLRPRDEAGAETDVHQHAGHEHGQRQASEGSDTTRSADQGVGAAAEDHS